MQKYFHSVVFDLVLFKVFVFFKPMKPFFTSFLNNIRGNAFKK